MLVFAKINTLRKSNYDDATLRNVHDDDDVSVHPFAAEVQEGVLRPVRSNSRQWRRRNQACA